MSDDRILIPPPPLLRERLAKNIREGRLLRALLRLSIRACQEKDRDNQERSAPRSERGTA
jgi:hypothetical protein